MKRLDVNLDAVVVAMDDRTGEFARHFLDSETGEVHAIGADSLRAVEKPKRKADDAAPLRDWEREELELARRVTSDPRCTRIDASEGGEAYRVMEDFIPRVRDERLRGRLEDAIAGKGAFRRFKDVLLSQPEVRQKWFDFENDVKRQWAREWLASLGIESSWQPPGPQREE